MKIILVDAINTLVIKGQGIFKEMHDLLEQYPNKKIIVTNANDEQIIAFGLNEMPYEVFTLKHNPEKTDPKYFQMLIKKYGITVEDIVYFEHHIDAVKNAQYLGIDTYHYDSKKKDLVGLKKFLDGSLI